MVFRLLCVGAAMTGTPTAATLRRNPLEVLALGIVSCGLYLLFWNLRVARVVNAVAGREVVSPAVALLAGLCPPVHLYFYYLLGEQLPLLAGTEALRTRLEGRTTQLLLLGLVASPVAAMVVQEFLNACADEQP